MFRAFCVSALVFGLSGVATGQTPPTTLEAGPIERYIEDQMKARGLIGLGVAVVHNGETILARGFGTTAIRGGRPVTADTPFAIGSVTKQFACASVMLLADDGRLTVRDPVAKYFPHLTSADEITLLDCMAHTSGYPDYYPLDFLDRRMRQPIRPDDLLRRYAGGPLDFRPRSRFSYSNTGYIVLGRVVEKVAGEPFADFIDRRVFTPLEMKTARFEPAQEAPEHARGHTSILLGPVEPATPEANGWLHAAGGISASVNDLIRWNRAVMESKLLKPDSWQTLKSPVTLANGRVSDYGGGLGIARLAGETVLQHSGAVSGFHAYSAMIPRTRSTVILLSNTEHADSAALHRELLQLVAREIGKSEPSVPNVAGPDLAETCMNMLRDLQAGSVDRTKLGEEFSLFLTDARIAASREKLRALGSPSKADVESRSERGGMEAARVRVTCENGSVRVNVFRRPDGLIEQFLLTAVDR